VQVGVGVGQFIWLAQEVDIALQRWAGRVKVGVGQDTRQPQEDSTKALQRGAQEPFDTSHQAGTGGQAKHRRGGQENHDMAADLCPLHLCSCYLYDQQLCDQQVPSS
jgi:hypothetical protein